MGRLSMSRVVPVGQRYPRKRISGALKSEDTVMDWIL
jgi:hypothetical protein